jgi:hypothetical protein
LILRDSGTPLIVINFVDDTSARPAGRRGFELREVAQELGCGFTPGFLIAGEDRDLAEGLDGGRLGTRGEHAHAELERGEHVPEKGLLLLQALHDHGDREVVLVGDLLDARGALEEHAQNSVDEAH